MGRLTCGIIQDLLPSYRDALTGESVTQMIQEHLTECPQCQKRYTEVQKQQDIADKEEASRGKSFGEKLKSIRYYIIGFIIGLTLPFFGIAVWFLIAWVRNYISLILL